MKRKSSKIQTVVLNCTESWTDLGCERPFTWLLSALLEKEGRSQGGKVEDGDGLERHPTQQSWFTTLNITQS